MHDLAPFLERFFDDELRARIAVRSDTNEDRVQRLLAGAAAFLDTRPGAQVTLDFTRTRNHPPTNLVAPSEARRQFHRRVLFVVVHVTWEGQSVARAIASSPLDPDGTRYDTAFVIEEVDGAPKIVGRAGVDPFAPTDEPLEWESLGGVQVPTDLLPERVEALQRPKDPGHAADYDRLVKEDGS